MVQKHWLVLKAIQMKFFFLKDFIKLWLLLLQIVWQNSLISLCFWHLSARQSLSINLRQTYLQFWSADSIIHSDLKLDSFYIKQRKNGFSFKMNCSQNTNNLTFVYLWKDIITDHIDLWRFIFYRENNCYGLKRTISK